VYETTASPAGVTPPQTKLPEPRLDHGGWLADEVDIGVQAALTNNDVASVTCAGIANRSQTPFTVQILGAIFFKVGVWFTPLSVAIRGEATRS
jgi:hypothetical protein